MCAKQSDGMPRRLNAEVLENVESKGHNVLASEEANDVKQCS